MQARGVVVLLMVHEYLGLKSYRLQIHPFPQRASHARVLGRLSRFFVRMLLCCQIDEQ